METTFFEPLDTKVPAHALEAIVAWYYAQNGPVVVTKTMVNDLADKVGLTIPQRSDMTLRVAKNEGKKLFVHFGKGYKLTTAGELYIKKKIPNSEGEKATGDW